MEKMTEANGVYRFNSKRLAESFRDRATKLMMIVLGDDQKFWVTTPRIAHKLMEAGYEVY